MQENLLIESYARFNCVISNIVCYQIYKSQN